MGSTLQRLEILLIGLVLLIAGAVVVVLLTVHPPSPAVYIQITPLPLATQSAAPPTGATSVTIEATPTVVMSPVGVLDLPSAATVVATPSSNGSLMVLPLLCAAWPWGALAVGLSVSALLLLRMRNRRMTYTHQSVGQLLAAADHATRATNVRVMRDLAERGVLTEELAAAAGIALPQTRALQKLKRILLRLPRRAWPQVTLPCMQLPRLRVPTVRLPKLGRLRRSPQPMTRELQPLPVTPLPQATSDQGASAQPKLPVDAVTPIRAAPSSGVPTAETTAGLGRTALQPGADPAAHTEPWAAEDRALATAAALDDIWTAQAFRSRVLALDTERTRGSGQVVVTIDVHPAEEEQLAQLPTLLAAQYPQWRAAWRRGRLVIADEQHLTRPDAGGPLIVPLLTHGHGDRMIRFCSLTAWPHLGIYGGGALGALHAALGSLLFNQPPAKLAVAIIDHGEITPLYRDVAHIIALPGTTPESITLLGEATRRGASGQIRPLMLIVIEPDALLLAQLRGIVARQRASRAAPLHLLLVQEQLVSAGREIYAMLPALISSGGRGSAALLPGQGSWPSGGAARLVSRDMRIEGRALSLDESAIATCVAQLRGERAGLPPVLWDTLAPTHAPSTLTYTGHAAGHQADTPWVGADHRPSIDCARPAVLPIETTAPDQDTKIPIGDGSGLIGDHESQATDERLANPDSGDQAAPPAAALAAVVSISESSAAPPAPLAIEEVVLPLAVTDSANSTASRVTAAGAASGTLLPRAPDAPSSRAALLRATSDAGQAAALSRSHLRPELSAPVMSEPHSGLEWKAAPAPTVEPDNGWPIGPTPLGRLAMADLMTRVVQAPAIITGQANELGVTKNRLVDLLKGAHKVEARELAEILMAWFDLAGLLIETTKPGRLRHPRALATTDLTAIAALLSTTPCPDKATVQSLWAESYEAST